MLTEIEIEEFKSLRDEMLKWQERRFEVLKIAILAASAIVTGALAQADKWEWSIASACILLVLALSARMIWLFGTYVSAGGAYLEVFLDSRWERRNRQRLSTKPTPTLNSTLALVHGAIGIISTFICVHFNRASSSLTLLFLWFPSLGVLSWGLYRLAYRSYPRSEFAKQWLVVKQNDSASTFEASTSFDYSGYKIT